MRILLTGTTARHIGRTTTLISTFSTCLAHAFRDLNVTLDHRAVVPGEDLSKYDYVICGTYVRDSMGASYVFGALWTIRQLLDEKVKGVVMIDDWNVRMGLKFGVPTKWDLIDKYRMPKSPTRHHLLSAEKHWKALQSASNQLLEKEWGNVPLLIPVFPWWNEELFRQHAKVPCRIIPIDRSAAALRIANLSPEVYPPSMKARVWISASLARRVTENWLKTKKLGWPVEVHGPVKMSRKTTLHERELFGRMRTRWGILCNPYGHSGSGWWRNRYLYTAKAGSVMFAEPAETVNMDASYQVPIDFIEHLGWQELNRLAGQQAGWLFNNLWSYQTLLDKMNEMILA